MKYDSVSELDKKWSKITLGCWELAPSEGWGYKCTESDAHKIVQNALEVGITAFDTAEGYGDGESERRLGKGLGKEKDNVIIISKIWPDADLTLEAYEKRLDNSLKALDRDYLDVYLVHWPADHFNTAEKSQKLADIMEALRDSGKTKLVGLSNFHKVHLDLLGANLSRFSIDQVPYNLLEREYEGETREICEANNIKYMAYSPLAKGLLAHEMSEKDLELPARKNDAPFSKELYPHAVKVFHEVQAIAIELNVQPINVAIAWVLAQKNILTAIVGSKKPEQVLEFGNLPELKLSNSHIQKLEHASELFAHYK
ncbi:MAG: general stress protein [Verrucomicrobia bacterium]|nr:MAG: general stress protein [Verrucomicrobiota bacterium]